MNNELKHLPFIAGRGLFSNLPHGKFRKVVFFVLLFISAAKFLTGKFISGFVFLVLALFMAPLVAGEIAFFIGRLARFFDRR